MSDMSDWEKNYNELKKLQGEKDRDCSEQASHWVKEQREKLESYKEEDGK